MSYAAQRQLQGAQTELPVAQPVYILRGHANPIHTLCFFRSNFRLLSGDADGWVVVWSLTTKRPVAVWKAHETTVLGAESWESDKIITHGRDGTLRVWALGDAEEAGMSVELPVEDQATYRKEPWLYHSLEVSSLTFCSFASCTSRYNEQEPARDESEKVGDPSQSPEAAKDKSKSDDKLLLAVPGSIDSSIVLYALPSEKHVALIPAPEEVNGKAGMVMAIQIFYRTDDALVVIAGYESGRTYVFQEMPSAKQWQPIYTSIPHSQPILSLDVTPSLDAFFTSGADAIIAKHPLTLDSQDEAPMKEVQTRHAGQQGLHVRSDGRIFATAGWDARVRVYSVKTVKELAVLKWHKDGCFAIAFAEIQGDSGTINTTHADQAVGDQIIERNTTVARPIPVQQARDMKAKFTHWLAAGSKDGKISLWDIY